MAIIDNSSRPIFTLPGLKHQTLASGAEQLEGLEVWMQTLEPGAATPVHHHECEEVLIILRGAGRLSVADEDVAFGPGTTLTVAPKEVQRLINNRAEEMWLIAVLSETAGRVFAPDDSVIDLPWT